MRHVALSDDQLRAVQSDSSAVVVVAGAGSGKTEVLAHRVERLLMASQDEGYRILAVSYTVKAADELRDRLAARLGDAHRRVDADTIHGFAHGLLRQHGTRIGLPIEPEVITAMKTVSSFLTLGLLRPESSDRPTLSQSWPNSILLALSAGRLHCLRSGGGTRHIGRDRLRRDARTRG